MYVYHWRQAISSKGQGLIKKNNENFNKRRRDSSSMIPVISIKESSSSRIYSVVAIIDTGEQKLMCKQLLKVLDNVSKAEDTIQ